MNKPIMKPLLLLLGYLPACVAWPQVTSGPLAPGGGRVIITKLAVVDCRVVRGCFGAPVDGSVHSWDYRGTVREYPNSARDGVGYAYTNNDGVHLELADADGFDVVVLRGGAKSVSNTS